MTDDDMTSRKLPSGATLSSVWIRFGVGIYLGSGAPVRPKPLILWNLVEFDYFACSSGGGGVSRSFALTPVLLRTMYSHLISACTASSFLCAPSTSIAIEKPGSHPDRVRMADTRSPWFLDAPL